jgi:hypothetical protein
MVMSAAVASEPVTLELDAARQFDFWLGEWDCTWEESGVPCVGTNSVYLDLGGKVVVENFDGRPSLDFQGLSYSVYDRREQCWKQTWVDSEGNYLDFAGGWSDGTMELRRRAGGSHFRMRWEHIEAESLDWSWSRSDDGGATWTPLWQIAYSRVL